jgi:hypothetical protein
MGRTIAARKRTHSRRDYPVAEGSCYGDDGETHALKDESQSARGVAPQE